MAVVGIFEVMSDKFNICRIMIVMVIILCIYSCNQWKALIWLGFSPVTPFSCVQHS